MVTLVLKNLAKPFNVDHFKQAVITDGSFDMTMRIQETSLERDFAFVDIPKSRDTQELRAAIEQYRDEQQVDAIIVETYDKNSSKMKRSNDDVA